MDDLAALAALTFNWTRALDDVWTPIRYHVEGLHTEAENLIVNGIGEANADEARPLGVVIQGERGVGKTHMLGWTRQRVHEAGGYFFLVGDFSGASFWDDVLGAMVEQLLPFPDGSRNQLGWLLEGLADRVRLTDGPLREAITGQLPPTPAIMSEFIAELRCTSPSLGMACQDTARALVLLASPSLDDQDLGYYFLTSGDFEIADRRRWGIRSRPKMARLLVSELSRLLAFTGPTVLAVDQIDALIDELALAQEEGTARGSSAHGTSALRQVATGLMSFRDVTRRTLTVLSCLPESWEAVRDQAVDTVADRFRLARQLRNIPSADIGRLMIEKRFAADLSKIGFEAPYASWPIRPEAFEEARYYTARGLLKRIDAHISQCLHDKTVTELRSLDDEPAPASAVPAAPGPFSAPDPGPLTSPGPAPAAGPSGAPTASDSLVDPAPVDPDPDPVDSDLVDPGPVDPALVDPGPVDPDPGPVDSAPGPVDSAPDPVDSVPDAVDPGPGPVDFDFAGTDSFGTGPVGSGSFGSDPVGTESFGTDSAGAGSAGPDSAGAARAGSASTEADSADGPGRVDPEFAVLDEEFARARYAATTADTVWAALSPETEDREMPALLAAGLEAWVRERGGENDGGFVTDPIPAKSPRLHACLRMELDTRTERQRRWSFRAIASDSARAVQSRLQKAADAARLADAAGHQLCLLRNEPWPDGPATEGHLRALAAQGGITVPVAEDDLRTFAALGELLIGRHPGLNTWLAARRPAHGTELFGKVLGDVEQL
jgi:hypothetical protein